LAIYYPQNRQLVLIYTLFIFAISLIREIIKDMEDVRGDASHGCKTLPIIWGLRRTKIVLYLLIGLFVFLLLWAAFLFQNQPLSWVFMGFLIPIFWLTYRIIFADTKREFGKLSTLCKIIMLLGMASMAVIQNPL
jgi:4-hydroxybenzoate polyprenyltransferase